MRRERYMHSCRFTFAIPAMRPAARPQPAAAPNLADGSALPPPIAGIFSSHSRTTLGPGAIRASGRR